MAAACSAVIFFFAPTSPQHLIKSPSESKRWARERHQKKTANWELFFCMGTLRWLLNNRHLDYIALSSSFAKAASQSIPSTSECSAWRAILAGSECLKYMKRNQLKILTIMITAIRNLIFFFGRVWLMPTKSVSIQGLAALDFQGVKG